MNCLLTGRRCQCRRVLRHGCRRRRADAECAQMHRLRPTLLHLLPVVLVLGMDCTAQTSEPAPVVPDPVPPALPTAPATPSAPAAADDSPAEDPFASGTETPAAPAPKPTAPKAVTWTPGSTPWRRLEIVEGWYAQDKIALLQPEAERLARHAAFLAAQQLSAGVLIQNAEAVARGRRLLALAFHLNPTQPAARMINDAWTDKRDPSMRPPEEDVPVIAAFALSAAERVRAVNTPQGEALARCLIDWAVELDPHNESCIYAAEMELAAKRRAPWEQMARGEANPPPLPQPSQAAPEEVPLPAPPRQPPTQAAPEETPPPVPPQPTVQPPDQPSSSPLPRRGRRGAIFRTGAGQAR